MLGRRYADRKRTIHVVKAQNAIYGRVLAAPEDARESWMYAAGIVAEAGTLTVDLLVHFATDLADRPKADLKRDRRRLMTAFEQNEQLVAAATFAAHGIVARIANEEEDESPPPAEAADLLRQHFPLSESAESSLLHGPRAFQLGMGSLELVYMSEVFDALLQDDTEPQLAVFDEWMLHELSEGPTLGMAWDAGGDRFAEVFRQYRG